MRLVTRALPFWLRSFVCESAYVRCVWRIRSYQFHRDTKLSELVGEAVIVRESVESAGNEAELVRQRTEPGGIATADICVLDDITRAPGEALNGESATTLSSTGTTGSVALDICACYLFFVRK